MDPSASYIQQMSCAHNKFILIDKICKTCKISCRFMAKFDFLSPLQWHACRTWQWPHRKRSRKIPMIHHKIPLCFNITNNQKIYQGYHTRAESPCWLGQDTKALGIHCSSLQTSNWILTWVTTDTILQRHEGKGC